MAKRTRYNGKLNAICPYCGDIVLEENLKRHQTKERCRRRTHLKEMEDEENHKNYGAPYRRAEQFYFDENTTYTDRLAAGFLVMSDG